MAALDSNPLISCAPECLTTVSGSQLPNNILSQCPSAQDDILCGLVAATNISFVGNYNEWSCDTNGITTTNPCATGAVWEGITCDDGLVNNLYLNNAFLTGIFFLYY